MPGIYWLAVKLLASKGGLCYVELINNTSSVCRIDMHFIPFDLWTFCILKFV